MAVPGYVLDGGIVGVAWATVLSNYLAFAFGVMQISRVAHTLPWVAGLEGLGHFFATAKLGVLQP